MNTSLLQAGLLVGESLFLAAAILLLFKWRERFGLLPLAALVGCTQYLQTILASTLYVRFGDGYLITPGSSVLFPASLMAVLLLYHQDGVPRARSLILGIVLSNITLTAFALFTTAQIRLGNVVNLLGVPEEIFHVNPRMFLAGTAVLLLDMVAVVVVFEILNERLKTLPSVVRLPLGLILVLAFDSLMFSLLAFSGHPALAGVLTSQLVSKSVAGVVYGLALFAFVHRQNPTVQELGAGAGSGTWAILTYRERFELLQRQKRAQEEAFVEERSRNLQALDVAESRFQALFRSISDSLIVIDASTGKIIEVNPALVQLSGFEAAALIGKSLAEVELLEADAVGGIDPQMSAEWESKLRRHDERLLDIEVRLVRFVTGSDPIVALVIRDITQRKAAELALRRSRDGLQQRVVERTEELRESEARYRDLFENSHDLIQAVDGAGRFLFVNDSWKRTLGYSDDETATLRLMDVVAPGSRESFRQFIQRLIGGEERGLVETEFIAKDNSTILVEGNVECAHGTDDSSVIRGIFRDVTERKAVELLKDRFVQTVSHELRTPLASIVGSLDLVASGKMGQLPPAVARFIAVASRNSQRLSWLINEILEFQKVEAGRLELEIESCELDAVIAQAIEDNQAYADRYNVHLVRSAGGETGRVAADRGWLLQVMTNLLSNAVKHSPTEAEVAISVAVHEETARVSVTDCGRGIPETFRDQVFQPFSQAEPGNKTEEGSSGLGLSIAKMLIESMQGELGFVCREGQGTTFYFDLPRWLDPESNRPTTKPSVDGPVTNRPVSDRPVSNRPVTNRPQAQLRGVVG